MQITITSPIFLAILRFRWWALVLAPVAVALAVLSVTSWGGGATPARATFPGANGKIAFTSLRDGNHEVYSMNADGTVQTNLTNNPASDNHNDTGAQWSSDGTKLAFPSQRDGNPEIYVMNADGTGQTRITNNAFVDNSPAFSPDGTKMVFLSTRTGNYEVFVMNADGTGQTNISNNAALDSGQLWSPDGTKIVFNSNRDGPNPSIYEIYVMNADGSSQTRLTTNAAIDLAADWSPDGSKIAFYSHRDGNAEIYVMNADGTSQTRLTTNAAFDGTPAWSPDGTKIAFNSNRDGNVEIYTMNADGTGQTRLTTNVAEDALPSWQPGAPLGPYAANISNVGQYALPKSCFEVRDAAQTPLFEVCDNDFAGAPEADAACAPDGICDDQAPALGSVTVSLAGGDYRIVEVSVAPQHTLDAGNEVCNNLAGACLVSFSSAPKTRPWHPWDITGTGGLPDGLVRIDDILQVVNHYFQDKPLP